MTFRDATFEADADFESATYKGEADYSVGGTASETNRAFHRLSFNGATFGKIEPCRSRI